MTDSHASASVRDKGTLFGHPKGLYVLFFTEMWERFSYYGMRALLVLYMTKYLINSAQSGNYIFGFATLKSTLESVFGPLAIQPLASQIYGLYTGFVYFTPFFGGMLADKLLGQRKTVVVGGVLMAIGHFLMAIESMFFIALLFLILGNGCFKPNISTQVGSLYPPGDKRRDRAFTIFYMGVNLGAFFAPLVCGTLGQVYGWHYGFTAAGVGMIIGLMVYLWGQKFLADDAFTRAKASAQVSEKQPLTAAEWRGVLGLIVLAALNLVFWAVYEQQGNTIQIFVDSNADMRIFGWEMPSTWFQSMNPMFIFLFTPLLNMFWGWQDGRKKEPSSVAKMAIGCVVLGVSFLILALVTRGMGAQDKVSFLWLMACTFLYTVGELYLSPIGLSLVTKVAPIRLVGMLMGMWYMSNFFGNYLTGYIGTFYEKMSKESFFNMLGLMAIAAGFAMFALKKPVNRAMGRED